MVVPPDNILVDGPEEAVAIFLFGHGAGAPMDASFMNIIAAKLAEEAVRVIRFEFPYMAKRRQDGRRRPPDRAPVLLQCWHNVIDAFGGPGNVFIGGKSMGGRMASLVAADLERDGRAVKGVICMGYPFHPPGKPEKLRTEHLAGLGTPTLILQGERDPFGKPEEVANYNLSPSISVHWLTDGDHGFKPRKASGRSESDNLAEAGAAIAAFIKERTGTE